MRRLVVIVILLMVLGTVAAFALRPRDCVKCGSRCCAGDCDQSSACAQCYIYDCVMGGVPQTLDCGMGC
jgi:hypothetical protein